MKIATAFYQHPVTQPLIPFYCNCGKVVLVLAKFLVRSLNASKYCLLRQ